MKSSEAPWGSLNSFTRPVRINRKLYICRLHGNQMSTEGVCKIVKSLIQHPMITCLDVGDCDIGDKALKYICELLPRDGDKPGLQELVLSANPRITQRAWEKFTVALAASGSLRALYLDYNNLGDTAGKMMVVAATGHKSLQILDLEACELTEEVGRLFMYLVQHFPTQLSHILLEENDITYETKYAIRIALGESESENDSSDSECEASPKQKGTSQIKSKRMSAKRSAPVTVNTRNSQPHGTNTTLQVPHTKQKKVNVVKTRPDTDNQDWDSSVGITSGRDAMRPSTDDRSTSDLKVTEGKSSASVPVDEEFDVTYTFKPKENTQRLMSHVVRDERLGQLIHADKRTNKRVRKKKKKVGAKGKSKDKQTDVALSNSPLTAVQPKRTAKVNRNIATPSQTTSRSPAKSMLSSRSAFLPESDWETDRDSPDFVVQSERPDSLLSGSCSELADLLESPRRTLSPQAILKESFTSGVHFFVDPNFNPIDKDQLERHSSATQTQHHSASISPDLPMHETNISDSSPSKSQELTSLSPVKLSPRFKRRSRASVPLRDRDSDEYCSSISDGERSDVDLSSESDYDMSKSLGHQRIKQIKALISEIIFKE